MVRNIIAKNLGKISVDEIYPHKNVRTSKGPDGLNIRGNIYIDDNIGIGTEVTNNSNLMIIGNIDIQSKLNQNKILEIRNNINNIVISINNNNIKLEKETNINNLKIINGLKVPVYENINDNLLNSTGFIIFNKTSNLYEGYDNERWRY